MRQLIIDGNAVYELDDNCMVGKEITDAKDEGQKSENAYRDITDSKRESNIEK